MRQLPQGGPGRPRELVGPVLTCHHLIVVVPHKPAHEEYRKKRSLCFVLDPKKLVHAPLAVQFVQLVFDAIDLVQQGLIFVEEPVHRNLPLGSARQLEGVDRARSRNQEFHQLGRCYGLHRPGFWWNLPGLLREESPFLMHLDEPQRVLMKGDDDRGRVLHGLQQVRGRQCEQLGISCRGQSGCVVPAGVQSKLCVPGVRLQLHVV
mmetsp:Transcript_16054/g.22432  ORF Transcript_16054/g.22432 Transcript_16054/m.22432 type:complete len:206 (+) Transcript_16054:1231-1848(+)